MELQHQLEIEDILKHYKEKVAEQIQEIVILKATIDALTKSKPVEPTTTAVTPVVDGPKGI